MRSFQVFREVFQQYGTSRYNILRKGTETLEAAVLNLGGFPMATLVLREDAQIGELCIFLQGFKPQDFDHGKPPEIRMYVALHGILRIDATLEFINMASNLPIVLQALTLYYMTEDFKTTH